MALEVLELRRVNEVDKYIVDKGIAIDGCIVKLFAKSKQRGFYPFKTRQTQHSVCNGAHNDLQLTT